MDGHPKLLVSLLAPCVVLGLACDGPDRDERSVDPERAFSQAKLSLSEAIDIARREHPEGVAFAADFEVEDGRGLFEVEFFTEGVVEEVYMDPNDGRVVEIKQDEDDLPDAQASTPVIESGVELKVAIVAAEESAQGRAFEIEVKDGVYQVGVIGDGGAALVTINPADGGVSDVQDGHQMEVEGEDEEEGDDDDEQKHVDRA